MRTSTIFMIDADKATREVTIQIANEMELASELYSDAEGFLE